MGNNPFIVHKVGPGLQCGSILNSDPIFHISVGQGGTFPYHQSEPYPPSHMYSSNEINYQHFITAIKQPVAI